MLSAAIVDDNQAIRTSITDALNQSGRVHVLFSAGSGVELLDSLRSCVPEELPDVVITDIHMPGMSGIEVVRQGNALFPQVSFVMLSVADDEDTLFDAIKAGASGYLTKNEPVQVIIEHLESLVYEGSAPMSPVIASKTLELLARAEIPVALQAVPPEVYQLSSREQEVLHLLVEGHDYKAIAGLLVISPLTVRKHISNIYEKLHISSKAQAIRLMQNARSYQSADRQNHFCRVLLVDDHQMILDSLSIMLSTLPEIQVAGKISDSRSVMSFLEKHDVDLIITDISMPYVSGMQLAEDVRSHYPELKTLMLTVSDDMMDMRHAYDIGVSGYVLKKAGKEELSHAIRTVMRGERYFTALAS